MSDQTRYTGYTGSEVFSLILQGVATEIQIIPGQAITKRSAIVTYRGEQQTAIFLARSSEWYRHSLNLSPQASLITLAIVGTHDSCLTIPVYALDNKQFYQPKQTRYAIADLFTTSERKQPFCHTEYGHAILVGAWMCDLTEAEQFLTELKRSTRLGILAEKRKLGHRRRGRPWKV